MVEARFSTPAARIDFQPCARIPSPEYRVAFGRVGIQEPDTKDRMDVAGEVIASFPSFAGRSAGCVVLKIGTSIPLADLMLPASRSAAAPGFGAPATASVRGLTALGSRVSDEPWGIRMSTLPRRESQQAGWWPGGGRTKCDQLVTTDPNAVEYDVSLRNDNGRADAPEFPHCSPG